ncbi:MAG: carboxypeptidase regulatory-like domain-containing protein, partial [Acidobacteriaceae bacterium]|nr:carboxypeptidase regulatory-like domain-containing protein [Acidobacteriaceae bacterium]
MLASKVIFCVRQPGDLPNTGLENGGNLMQVYRKLFATALVFAAAALAQLYTGSITGTVSDPSGAVVPNCRITALDVEKGFSFSTTSDSTGRYVLPSIPPGKYRVSIEADGFQPQVHENISMEVGQNVRVDFPLQVKTSSQSVEIKGEAPVLQSEDATTGQVINRRFINDLPLIDRNVLSLAYLTPGIVPTDTNSGGNDFVSNGGRNATADVLMDGVSTTNFEQNSGIQVPSYTPSVEAVEEFSVETANFSAEYGFSGSTIVNMVTRSGTNQFHGSAYDFLRNQVLDANNFFNNASGIPIAPLKRNNFGVTLGGPIRRDKTFFFMDYDGSRQTTMSTGNVFGVPSAAERQGNFGELCAAQGGSFDATGMCSAPTGQLWDPYSGTYSSALGGIVHSAFVPFNNLASYVSPGNPNLSGTPHQLQHVPGNLIDPVAFKLMQYFPLPNLNVGTGSYDPYNNYLASGPVHSQNDQFDVKLDHRFNDHDLLSVKYSHDLASGDSFNCFGNIADPCTQGPYSGGAHLVAINETHTISPTMLMTFSYGWNRVYATQG